MREVIEGAGGLVVVIPHSADPESWQDAYEIVDAVVMMGGPGRLGRGLRRRRRIRSRSPVTRASTRPSSASRARACGTGSRCSASAAAARCSTSPRAARSCRTCPRRARRSCTCGEWVRVVDDPPSCYHEIEVLAGHAARRLARSRQARRQLLPPPGGRPARRGAAHLGGRAGRHDRGDRVVNGAFAVGLQWHNEFHMRADARYARPLQALVEAARA